MQDRYYFWVQMAQADQTSISAWETAVRTAAGRCSFGPNADEFMRDKFLFGLNDSFSRFREDIFYRDGQRKAEDPPFTLAFVVTQAVSFEADTSTRTWPQLGTLTMEFISKNCTTLFQGLGFLGPPVDFDLDPHVKPIHAPVHRQPISKLDSIKKALDAYETTGQLVRVSQPTDWISNMVIREREPTPTKPGKIRICLDPSQTLDKAIRRPKYIIPTLEENLQRLHGMKYMTVIDVKEAFQNIPLTLRSSLMTTMYTPWGRYRWTRLPLGISSAFEEWQRRIHMVLEGLQIISIANDILIPGCGTTDAEARIDHDRNLIAVLERFEQHHVKLNLSKMKFLVREAVFMGHVITTDGLQPNPVTVQAIVNMPIPKDKQGIRRFLGAINYLSKFCSLLNTVTQPPTKSHQR